MSDAIHPVGTASQTVGPFFHLGMTRQATGRVIGPLGAAAPITLAITVTDGDGLPVPDACIEIWQAASDPGVHGGDDRMCVFGRMGTDAKGTCEFETVRPEPERVAGGAARAGHINVCVFARGLLRQVHTRIYFPDDAAIDGDPVLAVVPEPRRRTLFATADGDRRWTFPVRLQGDDETVFFSA